MDGQSVHKVRKHGFGSSGRRVRLCPGGGGATRGHLRPDVTLARLYNTWE